MNGVGRELRRATTSAFFLVRTGEGRTIHAGHHAALPAAGVSGFSLSRRGPSSSCVRHLSGRTIRQARSLSPWPEHCSSFSASRSSSSSSSTRWKTRQTRDSFAREARVAGLKSRAAFKLLEIHAKYRLFRRGDTVVDLGFAPGSWSQVAVSKTSPGGRVVGIDVIPAQPPRGANALQGNFLSAEVRERVREFVGESERGRVGGGASTGVVQRQVEDEEDAEEREEEVVPEQDVEQEHESQQEVSNKELDLREGRVVNVVLSDMSAPWPLVTNPWVKSVNNPYLRMMNTSGMSFRDHAGSMDLCLAALDFCHSTLATGGHFLTKFYTGAEDHLLEARLKRLFEKVHRIKPDSSRKESKEAYFLALRRRSGVAREVVLGDVG